MNKLEQHIEKQRELIFSEMNEDEFVKISIDVKNCKKQRLIELMKAFVNRLEKSEPHFDNSHYTAIEGGSVLLIHLTVNNEELATYLK